MASLLNGKGALAPDLPFLQGLPVFIGLPSVSAALDSRFKIAVLQLTGAAPVILAEAFVPHRAADAVRLLCLILPQ